MAAGVGLLGCGSAKTREEEAGLQTTPSRFDASSGPADVDGSTPTEAPARRYEVQPGDTLWDLARRHGSTVAAIESQNELSEDHRLRPGDVLLLPAAPKHGPTGALERGSHAAAALPRVARAPLGPGELEHVMAPGQTLWSLSRHYGVRIDALMTRNGLDDETAVRLRSGDRLWIPASASTRTPPVAPLTGLDGAVHTMVEGETVWDLSRVYGLSAAEIMAANTLDEAGVRRLRAGDRVLLPGVTGDRDGAAAGRRLRRQQDNKAARLSRALGLGTLQTARTLLGGKPEARWLRAAGGATLPGTLRWPVSKGFLVRGYGSGEGGYHLAMDIMGEIGWNVRAAAEGLVAYAGAELRGYGNAVLVVHPGGWITLYAHNSVNFAQAGQHVRRGEVLAEVGSTGISRGPHVHFELIFAGTNCDPAALMRPSPRTRRGPHVEGARARWYDPRRRPAAVRCAPRRRHPQSRWVQDESPAEAGAP